MGDARLRALERTARLGGDPGARAALLRERIRRGEVAAERVRLAAYLGDAAAHAALADDLPAAEEARAVLATMWGPGIDASVHAAWEALLAEARTSPALAPMAPLVLAAAEAPPLRRLFCGATENDLVFSRCARHPLTEDVSIGRVGPAWIVHARHARRVRAATPAAAAAAAAAALRAGDDGEEAPRWLGRRQDLPLEVARLGGPWPPRRGDDLLLGLAVFGPEVVARAAAAVAALAAAEWASAHPGEDRVGAVAAAVLEHARAPSPARAEACARLARPLPRLASLREQAVELPWPEGLRLGRLARIVHLAATRLDAPVTVLREPPGLQGGDGALRDGLVRALLPWALGEEVAQPRAEGA